VWRAERKEIDTWATPLVVETNGRAQVVTSGMNRLRSYDIENGNIVWESAGVTMNPIPSPVAADGMVFVTSGFRVGILSAFDAKTDKPHYQLQRLDGVPNVFASPVAAGGRVYVPGREGATLVSCD